MTTPRLKAHTEKEIIRDVLSQYDRQHIKPLLVSFPVLENRKNWFTVEDFETLATRTAQSWIQKYPEKPYQQLQQKAEQRKLTTEERHDLETSIHKANQRLIQDNQKRNQSNQDAYKQCLKWYRENKKAYLSHPMGGAGTQGKPSLSEKRFQPSSFTVSDSPFQVETVFSLLSDIFQQLADKQTYSNFVNSPHLEADRQQAEQQRHINQQGQRLIQSHQRTQDRDFQLKAKEAELKRKLEQLERLGRIAEGYNNIPDAEELTSPAEQLEALEKLLAEKRRR